MASRRGYLVNNPNPGLVKSDAFDVREGAVRLVCSGINGSAPLQVCSGDPGDPSATWVPVVRNGIPIVLSSTNNQYVEIISGKYRFQDPGGEFGFGNNAIIWFEEAEETDHDAKLIYVYGASGNMSGAEGPPGPQGPAGTAAVSADAGNLLTLGTDVLPYLGSAPIIALATVQVTDIAGNNLFLAFPG